MNTYQEVIEIFKGLAKTNDYSTAVAEIDLSIDLNGMYLTAKNVNALDENLSCTDFSINHMTAYNNLFGQKY